MNPLYLDSLVSWISVYDGSLVVKDIKKGKILEKFKPREIPYDALIIQRPQGSITFNAINWLKVHSISVSILDWQGNIISEILPKEPIANSLKIAQYESYINRKKHLSIARTLVETKIQRQRELLKSLSLNYPLSPPRMERINANSEDFMRNQEARYASAYFEQLGIVFKELGHDFTGRGTKNNMNANDLPNALLNYGYSCLQTYVRRAINSIGLDNSIPFLHDLRPARTGLVYDLMELWRINVDHAVIQTLGELRSINYNVFRLNDNFQATLSQETARLLFERVRSNLSLEEIIFNVRILANYLLEDRRTLEFALKPIQIKEIFETERVKELILNKSARQLGMNKSSLWYQKKILRESGRVRLYNVSKHNFV